MTNKFYMILTKEEIDNNFFSKHTALEDAKKLAEQTRQEVTVFEAIYVFKPKVTVTKVKV